MKGPLATPGTTGPVPSSGSPFHRRPRPRTGPSAHHTLASGLLFSPPTLGYPLGHPQPHASHAPSHSTTSQNDMSHKTVGVDVTRPGQT